MEISKAAEAAKDANGAVEKAAKNAMVLMGKKFNVLLKFNWMINNLNICNNH